MRDLILALIIFGSLPLIVWRPFLGILMLAWIGYMNPHRLCYSYMYNFPVVQVVVAATLLGMLMSKEAKRMVWSREIGVLAVLVLWMGVTTSLAFYGQLALDEYIKVLKIQILTVMTLLMLTTPGKVTMLMAVISLSVAFYGVKGGVFTLVHGGMYRVQGPGGTFIGGNNEIALALVMTIPLLRYVQLQLKRQLPRHGLTVIMLLCALAAVGSQSRGALVALTFTGVMFWLKGRNKLFIGLFIAVSAAVVVNLMPETWWKRMNTIETYQQDNSALGRLNAWSMAWNLALDRVTGGGFETFRAEIFDVYAPEPNRVHDSHSIYFEMLGEHGFIGLGLFLALLGLTWIKCTSIKRFAKGRAELAWCRDLAGMVQVSLVAYMTGGAFLGLANFDYVYHLVAIVVATHHLMRNAQTVPAADEGGGALPVAAPERAANVAGRLPMKGSASLP